MTSKSIPVVGPHEIRVWLGVSRQRVYQITSREDFPEPGAAVEKATRTSSSWSIEKALKFG
jgi:hypothetical protein